MNLKQAQQRIEELERRVKELEAQPRQEFHFHNTYQHPWKVEPSVPYDPYKWIMPTPVICGAMA